MSAIYNLTFKVNPEQTLKPIKINKTIMIGLKWKCSKSLFLILSNLTDFDVNGVAIHNFVCDR